MNQKTFGKILSIIVNVMIDIYSPILDRGPHNNTIKDKIILFLSVWFVTLLPFFMFLIILYISYFIGLQFLIYIIGILLLPFQLLLLAVGLFLTIGILGKN